jgi:PAS domain S-box-containing protein
MMVHDVLAAREQELAAIYENVPGIVFYVAVEPDGEFRFLSMSQAGLAATGLPRERFAGSLVSDVIPEPSRDLVLGHYREAIRTGRTVRWREVSVYPAGRKVGEVAVTPLHDSNGVVTHLVGIVHDITERERLEEALHQREQRLHLALQASAAGLWTRDAGANQVDWDEGFRRLYGFSPDEPAMFDVWLSRVHPDDRGKVLDLLDETHHPTRDAWDATFRIVRPDGTVAWIQSLGRVERDRAGEITRLAGLELDVTARREAEEARQARRDEEHNRELRLLLETATQGILSVDARGTILMANRALETMFGWSPGELIGHSIEELVPLAVRALHARNRADYFAAPTSRLMTGLELVGERKDGSTFPIEVTLNHVATPSGGHGIAFVSDITERQRATAELERRMVQLRQLASDLTLAEQHAREQLAKTLHDGLQQLLVTVALNLDQQMQRDALGERGIGEPLVQAKAQLNEAILAARSLSFELFPPVLHSSGLAAALTWLADWMRGQYGLVVQVSADPDADSDRKDVRTLLFESVRELLFNVVKHARVDRVTVDLVRASNDMLCITVADKGIGFDPATLDDVAKADQMGWGLFSIRERLALLGGWLDVESAPGRGTQFRLLAPRGPAVDNAATTNLMIDLKEGGESRGEAEVASTRALRILIVDDHVGVRRAYRELLEARPELQVVGDASDGFEAIAQARALRPDVILMDVMLPIMDGVEATRLLGIELPFTQILGLSTQTRTGVHAIEQAGAVGFFTKGVDTHRLIDCLLDIHAANRPRTAKSALKV